MSDNDLIVCPLCKEWTTKEENCCNAFDKENYDKPTEKQILRKYKRLRTSANIIFGKQLGEDAAQNAILKILEGKSIKQRASFALIDGVRDHRGTRYRDRSGRFEPSKPNEGEFNSEIIHVPRSETTPENQFGSEKDLFNFIQLISSAEKPIHREILILYYCYEFKMEEISKFYGVSQSRICQHINYAKICFKKKALSKGFSQSQQGKKQQGFKGSLPQEIKTQKILQNKAKEELAIVYKQKEITKSELGKRAFFKIPKALFPSLRKTKETNARSM